MRRLSKEYLSIPMPEALKEKLRRLAAVNYATLADTARRLIAHGVREELAKHGEEIIGE